MDQIVYYFFNWTLISPHLPEIMQGFWVTLQMAVMTVILGTVLGLGLAVLRCSRTGSSTPTWNPTASPPRSSR